MKTNAETAMKPALIPSEQRLREVRKVLKVLDV
jgi:hypothetical protein